MLRSPRSIAALAGGVVTSTLLAGALFTASPAGADAWPGPSNTTATPDPVAKGSNLSLTWDCGPSIYLAGGSVRVIGVGDGEEVLGYADAMGIAPTSYATTVAIPAGWTAGTGSVEYKCSYSVADDSYHSTASLPLTIGTAPSFTDPSVGAMVVGTPFSDGVAASGSATVTYAVTAGALPAGLSLDPVTGAITGTPTGAGTYAFTITATNDLGTDVVVLTGTVGAADAAPTFTDVTVAAMTVGLSFTDGVLAVGTPAPAYAVATGALPPGIVLDAATGALAGTPTTPGNYRFAISAGNTAGTVAQSFDVVVTAPPSAPPDNDGTLDVSVIELNPEGSTTLVATGYKPGTDVAFVIYSEPLMLGTTVADANGVATLVVTLPADFPTGDHTVVSLGQDALGGDRVMSQQVVVSTVEDTSTTTPDAELPRTGSTTLPGVFLGALLLAGGAFLVVRGRRFVG